MGTITFPPEVATQIDGAIDGSLGTTGGSIPIKNIIGLLQAEYDAIVTKDPNTLYLIV